MQTVVETPIFSRRAQKLLTEAEHMDLIASLAAHPEAGDEIGAFVAAIKLARKAK
jgi:hypothetical protein